MVDVLTWLRAQDPTPALPLLRRALAVLIALLAGALAVLLLARPPHGEMARLLHDARAQGSFLRRRARAWQRLDRAVLGRVETRLARAGLVRVHPLLVLVAAPVCGLGGALLGGALLPAPPFVLLSALGGLLLPWSALGRRARTRLRTLNQQVVNMLWVIISSLVGGESMPLALLEVYRQGVSAPLRAPLRRALNDVVPARGVANRPFLEVLTTLERELASPAFTLAEHTIAAHQKAHGGSLVESLERVASLAQEEITDQAETRGDFALTRATAGFMFLLLPLIVTILLHWVIPGAVELAYSGVWGWVVACGLGGACLSGYRLATAGERAALAEGAI